MGVCSKDVSTAVDVDVLCLHLLDTIINNQPAAVLLILQPLPSWNTYSRIGIVQLTERSDFVRALEEHEVILL